MSCQLLAEALSRSRRCYAVAAPKLEAALQLLGSAAFDIILIGTGTSQDLLESLRVFPEIRGLHPEVRIVVLLDTPERNLVVEAFRSGAQGVFCRSESFEDLCKCILRVHEGQVWAGSAELQFVLEALIKPLPMDSNDPPGPPILSKREEEIARLVAEGCSNRQISQRLDLSEHTIKNYLFRVYEKLGVSTRVGLALFALKSGNVALSKPKAVDSVAESVPELRKQELG
jgi:DNA-binding NarL/FixJ family response regulator